MRIATDSKRMEKFVHHNYRQILGTYQVNPVGIFRNDQMPFLNASNPNEVTPQQKRFEDNQSRQLKWTEIYNALPPDIKDEYKARSEMMRTFSNKVYQIIQDRKSRSFYEFRRAVWDKLPTLPMTSKLSDLSYKKMLASQKWKNLDEASKKKFKEFAEGKKLRYRYFYETIAEMARERILRECDDVKVQKRFKSKTRGK